MNETAIKWYKYLEFPPEYDEKFYELAESKDISDIPAENTVEYLENKKDYAISLIGIALFIYSHLPTSKLHTQPKFV